MRPLFFEDEQRLAHRRPPDAETLHQLTLGGQWLAELVATVENRLLQPLGQLLVKLLPTDAFDVQFVTC